MRPAPARTLPLLLLAGCGGHGPQTTDDPAAQNVVEAAAAGTPAAVAAATDCGSKPAFVPVYPDAQIRTCVAGPDRPPHHVAGTIVYWTRAAPAEVLGWSRTQGNASGLAQHLLAPDRYQAGEEAQRSLLILAEPADGGTRVTVNWGSPV